MRTLILVLLSGFAWSAYAQMLSNDCQHLSNAAQGIMKLRQNGVAYDQLKNELTHISNRQQQQLFVKLLNDAFSTPVVQDEGQKTQLIQGFSRKYQNSCGQ